jgi:uncharacterized delta-60 repeat protein
MTPRVIPVLISVSLGTVLAAGSPAWAATPAPDPTFGVQGRIHADAERVVVQSTGAVVTAAASGGSGIELRRVSASGSSDPTFGTNGATTLSLMRVPDLAVDAANRIIAVGTRANAIVITRLTSNGVPDRSFGTGGTTEISGSGKEPWAEADGFAFGPSGTIIVTGRTGNTVACSGLLTGCFTPGTEIVARLDQHGVLDGTFGVKGISPLPLVAGIFAKPAVAADGSVVVGGVSYGLGTRYGYDGEADIVRLTPRGALDPTFGTNGQTVLPRQWVTAVRIDTAGRILLAGGTTIVRLTGAGKVDPTFGLGGTAQLTSWMGMVSFSYDPATQRLVAVGTSQFPESTLLDVLDARTGATQSAIEVPDSFFARDGALAPGGKVVLSFRGLPDENRYIARYTLG